MTKKPITLKVGNETLQDIIEGLQKDVTSLQSEVGNLKSDQLKFTHFTLSIGNSKSSIPGLEWYHTDPTFVRPDPNLDYGRINYHSDGLKMQTNTSRGIVGYISHEDDYGSRHRFKKPPRSLKAVWWTIHGPFGDTHAFLNSIDVRLEKAKHKLNKDINLDEYIKVQLPSEMVVNRSLIANIHLWVAYIE